MPFFPYKALYNKTCLIPPHIAFQIPFRHRYPITTNRFCTFWQWDKILHIIILYGLYLLIYDTNPLIKVRTSHGLMKTNQIIFHHPMPTSCYWRNAMQSSSIALPIFLVDLLNSIGSSGGRV